MTPPALLFLTSLALSACAPAADPALADVRSAAPADSASPCPAGQWRSNGACRPAETAFAAPGGRTFVVDGGHPAASDDNPGTADRPWRRISRAARAGALSPGDAVVVRAGVYRESVRPRSGGTGPGARVTFAAWPGERVVVTGADPADDGWRPTPDGAWRRPWTGPSLESYSDDPVFRRELVVAGGDVLRPVAARADLAPGRFWAEGPDRQPTAVVARFAGDQSPAQAGPVEVAHRTRLFWPEGPDADAECGDPATPGWLRVVGLTFRHAANRAQWGAVCAGSVGGAVEDVAVEWTNGRGVDVSGRGHTFRRTRADHNGQLGWGGSCQSCLIEDGAAVGNNWKGHDPFWEAGGAKWTRTLDTTVRRFTAAGNGGPGIWLDIDNDRNTVEGSLAVDNEVAGIMLELRTTRTLVQHNVVARTRWREWSGAGILSQAASENTLSHNTVVDNEGTGVWLRLDPDRRAPDGRNTVENNWVAGNAAPGREARGVAVEGTSPAHVRSNRFRGNRYALVPADAGRSTFFVYPAPDVSPGGFRGADVAVWRRLTGAERDVVSAEPAASVSGRPTGAGSATAGPRPYARVGADPARVAQPPVAPAGRPPGLPLAP